MITGVTLTRNHDKPHAITVKPQPITLAPVRSAGANPFMASVGKDVKNVVRPAKPGGTFPANTVGLYGGSLSISSCDRQKLVTYLQQNPAKAVAWAGVLGIQPAGIPRYAAGLTPVVLRSDTYVTNHGFVNGYATTVPAVLQAGTAVLVDAYGIPSVKCYCGNPLTPPLRYSGPGYVGSHWNYFDITTITAVVKTTVVINTFTLVDPVTGKVFLRRGGTNGRFDRPMVPKPTATSTQPPAPIPDLSVQTGYVRGKLYKHPAFPATIGIDNHDYIADLNWGVSSNGASAIGVLNEDNCVPDCAGGTFIKYRVQVVASNPKRCTVTVFRDYSDVANSVRAYVYSTIYVRALSGTPSSSLVGDSVIESGCGASVPAPAPASISPAPSTPAQTLPPPVQLSPSDGTVFNVYPRVTTLTWQAVPAAARYVLQMEACQPVGCQTYDEGSTHNLSPLIKTVTSTRYTFYFVGAQPGRWRVMAVARDGAPGPFSPWWGFTYLR